MGGLIAYSCVDGLLKKAISTYLIDSKVIIVSESIMLLVSISCLAYSGLSKVVSGTIMCTYSLPSNMT